MATRTFSVHKTADQTKIKKTRQNHHDKKPKYLKNKHKLLYNALG